MNQKQISQDDLMLFALQDLTPEEAAEVLVHLEHSETARAELAKIQGDLATYALTSELHSPPAQARERLLRGVAKERKLVHVDRAAANEGPVFTPREGRVFPIDEAERPRSGMGAAGWAGWALAACSIAAAGFEYYQHQTLQDAFVAQNVKLADVTSQAERAQAVMKVLTDSGAMQVALHLPASGTAEPPKPEGRAAYVAETGSLVFVGMHLAPLEPYKTYQLWVIPTAGAPIPAGVFKPDERGYASVILPTLPKGVTAKMFGVTIEDDGGSKTPTKPIVLAG